MVCSTAKRERYSAAACRASAARRGASASSAAAAAASLSGAANSTAEVVRQIGSQNRPSVVTIGRPSASAAHGTAAPRADAVRIRLHDDIARRQMGRNAVGLEHAGRNQPPGQRGMAPAQPGGEPGSASTQQQAHTSQAPLNNSTNAGSSIGVTSGP